MVTEFQRDCYAITSSGNAMPGRFLGLDGEGRSRIQAPNGMEYTFHSDNILTVEECEEQLHRNRVAKVLSSYQFSPIRIDRAGMVVQCVNPEHPVRSNYVLTIGNGRQTCSCPAYIKAAGAGCKHLEAYEIWSAREADLSTIRPSDSPNAHSEGAL